MNSSNEILYSLTSDEILGVLNVIHKILDIEFDFENLKYVTKESLILLFNLKFKLLLGLLEANLDAYKL